MVERNGIKHLAMVGDSDALIVNFAGDWSRTDMIIGDDGEPVFLEVNVSPGMTETSLLPLAVEAAGLDLGTLLLQLADVARRRGAR